LLTGEAGGAIENAPLSPEARKIEAAFTPYFAARGRFRLDPEGRSAKHTHFSENEKVENETVWRVAQMLIDAEEHNDWEVRLTVSLGESRAQNRAIVRFEAITAL
jgi:hypothetical protein